MSGDRASADESDLAALLGEGARLFDSYGSCMEQTPPEAGKTPTTPVRVEDLAATVDGGNGNERISYSPSSQGGHVSSIGSCCEDAKKDDYLPGISSPRPRTTPINIDCGLRPA